MPKKECIKLIRDFIIPSLDSNRFHEKMKWIDEEGGIFGLDWIHKSNSRYSQADGIVYEQWSQLKRLWNPSDPKAISKAKQRFRAALRKQRNLEKIEHRKNYRKYKIKDIKEIRQQLKNKTIKAEDSDFYNDSNISEYFQINYKDTCSSSDDEIHAIIKSYSEETSDFDEENSDCQLRNVDYFNGYIFDSISYNSLSEDDLQLFEKI